MRQPLVLLTSLLAVLVASQSQSTTTTQDAFSSFLSSYSSYFDSITRTRTSSSVVDSASSVTATSVESASSTASQASVTSTAISRTLTSRATDSSSIQSESSPSGSGAAASSSPTSGSAGSNRDRIIAIAVGSVLGALALGLFILLLIIIFDRRRHRRNARRKGSVASASEEALASRNRPLNTTATTGAFGPQNSQPMDQRGNPRVPLMSERSNLDGPPVSDRRNDYIAPYTSRGGEARRSSGLLPSQSSDDTRADGRFTSGTGLNNHPYQDSQSTGSVLSAGAGGAAVGAAAAGRSSLREEPYDPRLSRGYGSRQTSSSEPSTRSTKRTSRASSDRRSGTEPRGRLYGPQDYAINPLREETSPTDVDRGSGAVAGTVAARAGRLSREAGRNLPTDPLLPEEQSQEMSMSTPRNSRGKRTSAYQSLPQDVLTTDLPAHQSEADDTLGQLSFEPAFGTAPLASDAPSDSRSRSHPIPPSLTIPNPNLKRSRLSRGSKRARFAGGDTYHGPSSYEQGRVSDIGISPPGTARSTNFGSTSRRLSGGTAETEELVSPVSPDSMTRGVGRSVSLTHGRASFVNTRDRDHSPHRIKRRPVSDTSFRISPPTSESNSIPGDEPKARRRSRPHSGLVSAVRDHFGTSSPRLQPSPQQVAQTPTYQAYVPPEAIRPSATAPATNIASAPSTTQAQKPITRKPVPRSRYSGWKPLPQLPTDSSGGATRENWWRDQDDPAWSND